MRTVAKAAVRFKPRFRVEGEPVTDVRRPIERVTLSVAQKSYFEGDFEACLAACEVIVVHDEPLRVEVALMRARAFLRLARGEKAIDALQGSAYASTSPDSLVTAEMLLGTAYDRIGQQERGEALLVHAHDQAAQAHPTIRAEVALNLAVARYGAGRHADADALLATVPADADIIFARALEYRGWISFSLGRFEAAAARFRAALCALDSCARHDRFVEANILQGLATLSAELLQTEDWPAVEARILGFDWSLSSVARPRFWVAMYASMMREVLGDPAGARAWARRAESEAPDTAYRAIALCRTAAIVRGLREPNAHLEFALRARDLYEKFDVCGLAADQKHLSLFIAEELAYARASADASRLLVHYREIILPTLSTIPGDARFEAVQHAVKGCISDARGDRNAAVSSFARALAGFARVRYRHRATAVALRLARLTGKARYARYAAAALRGSDPHYWMAVESRELTGDDLPVLTDNQRAILALVAQGKSYKQIGAQLGRSWRTVGNSVEQLRAKFGVATRGELVAQAVRRGIVDIGAEGGRATA